MTIMRSVFIEWEGKPLPERPVDHVPEGHWRLFLRHLVDRKTLEEIAAENDMSVGQIRSRINTANAFASYQEWRRQASLNGVACPNCEGTGRVPYEEDQKA